MPTRSLDPPAAVRDGAPPGVPSLTVVEERKAARRARRLADARWGTGFVVRRIGAAFLTLLIVTVIVFLLVRGLGGDIARTVGGPEATEEQVDAIREDMGLNRALPVQYVEFVTGVFTGDLGTSARTKLPVADEIIGRIPASLQLAITATLIGSTLGIALGVVAAARHNTAVDFGVSVIAVIGMSVPVFWLGLMAIRVFSVQLGWLPVAGRESTLSLVLPSLVLSLFPMALVARMTRANMLESLNTGFARTARSKGVRRTAVLFRHALRNAFVPIVTVIGLQFSLLLTGAVLVESVFAWPGLGRYLVDAVAARDIAVVQGVAVAYAMVFIVANLIVDLLYVAIDPRIRRT